MIMRNIIIILFVLVCNNLHIYSRGISGPTRVDGGGLTSYIGDFSGMDFSAKVTWRVTHGRFNNPLGPTSVTQTVANNIVVIIWDDSAEKGVITASAAGIGTVRLEVDINSVRNMYITDFWCNGTKVTNDIISLPLGKSGTIECTVTDLEYPITHIKMSYQWSIPKSWGGGFLGEKRTVKINYNADTGNGEKIVVTPVGYGGVMGNSKTITIKRDTSTPPPPPPFDGNIKNVTITSNKTYKHSNIYVENVTIKSGANVVMNGYNSVRIVPGFTAELGSTIRIYNGTVSNAQTRTIVNEEEGGIKESIEVDKNIAKLYQNYPSPAYSMTTIPCVIPEKTRSAYIQVYNLMGVLVLKIPITSIGQNSIDVNTTELTNGVYMYSLIVDDCLIDTKRMVVAN